MIGPTQVVMVDEIVEDGNAALLLVKDETGRSRAVVADLVSRGEGGRSGGSREEGPEDVLALIHSPLTSAGMLSSLSFCRPPLSRVAMPRCAASVRRSDPYWSEPLASSHTRPADSTVPTRTCRPGVETTAYSP
jgi:hypothetical protein